MNDSLNTGLKRTAELSAIFMIGNGLIGLLQPKRHLKLWTSDMPAIDAFVRADRARSPAQRWMYGLLQVGMGVLLASKLK